MSNVICLTAPADWASYLINGDASGLDETEKHAADAWLARHSLGSPVDCTDVGFVRYHDAREECPYMAACCEYTFIVSATA